jgi:hypothetical protein
VTLHGILRTAKRKELNDMEHKPIYIIGDIHGEWNSLIRKIESSGIRDCHMICVGDFGIGFYDPATDGKTLSVLNEFFEERNIMFRTIRGNHDDPSWFDGTIKYSNLVLQRDYSIESISDIRFGFVGGAVSIDRNLRKLGRDLFTGEEFKYCPEKILPVDVVITHSAPLWNGPHDKTGLIVDMMGNDVTLWDECYDERLLHSRVISEYRARHHYCGHFHLHSSAEHDGCRSRILDILEIVEHRV